jgi:predicted ATPase
LISDATRRLVGDVFKLEELQLGRLKGGNKPVTIWRVIGEKEVTSRFAAHAVSFTNFVGRDQEVALLTDRWHQAVQGEGQVLVLLGEAGIGKSRIVEAFRQLVSNESHTTVRYQCSPYHIDSALHPIIRQLEHAAGLAAEDPPSVKLDKLEALLRRGTTSLEEVIPLFAALLSIPTDGRCPPLDPDPQRRKERTLNALIDQLAGPAQEGSVLIILEDVHWADPTTLEFLGRAIPRLSEMHVLLIMTGRPQFKVP